MSEQCLGTTSLEVEYEEKIKTGSEKSGYKQNCYEWFIKNPKAYL